MPMHRTGFAASGPMTLMPCRSADNNRLKNLVPELPPSLLYLCAPSRMRAVALPLDFGACYRSANNNSLEELPDLKKLTQLQRLYGS
jgi:hypothetical protein